MIFYIVLAVWAVAVVWAFIWMFLEDGFLWALINGLLVAALGALVGCALLLLAGGIAVATNDMTPVRQHSENLQALATSQSVEGHFFLGSGYIDGEATFSYITENDGAFNLRSVDADQSTVYIDSDPHVTTYEWELDVWWAMPWPISSTETYGFFVPEGSILNSYEVAP